MSNEAKSVDSLLVQDMQERIAGEMPKPHVPEIQHVANTPDNEPQEQHHHEQQQEQQQEKAPEQVASSDNGNDPYNITASDETTSKQEVTNESSEASPIDEYGNPVEKPRLYTEEELNQRIRERLSRGKYAQEQQQQPQQQQQQQYTQQQVNQAQADGFQHDPNSEENWEQQLERFINQTIEKRQAKQDEERWRQQEYEKQMQFQEKFTSGMNKYKDFHDVVAGKPITDSMMLATRNMDNPAAFVYAASKLHPQELDRISRIGDPYVQAAEVGKLHERMVKERKGVTNAPKPLQQPRGDVPSRVAQQQPSIDQRIAEHAKQKRR